MEIKSFISFFLISAAFSLFDICSCRINFIDRFETQHGALCAIGYVAANYLSRTPVSTIYCTFLITNSLVGGEEGRLFKNLVWFILRWEQYLFSSNIGGIWREGDMI